MDCRWFELDDVAPALASVPLGVGVVALEISSLLLFDLTRDLDLFLKRSFIAIVNAEGVGDTI